MIGCYLGSEFDDGETQTRLKAAGARFATPSRDQLLDRTARALADGKAVGWFQGRMELGPRALGNRSSSAIRATRKCRRSSTSR
jgi:carbamoyltransferase